MSGRSPVVWSRRGFTLIELLVVVAIIALLLALLIPSLARARDVVKTAKCAGNEHEIGRLELDFAAGHNGRLAGGGTGLYWVTILNAEVLGIKPNDLKSRPQVQNRWYATAGNIICPSYQSVPLQYTRFYAINSIVPGPAGGSPFLSPAPSGPTGQIWPPPVGDGLLVPPPIGYYSPDLAWGPGYGASTQAGWPPWFQYVSNSTGGLTTTGSYYFLGVKRERFGDYQFLMGESNRGGDYMSEAGWPPDNPIKQIAGSDQPWTYEQGGYAFRHNSLQRANFLFFDGHVESLKPADDVNSLARWYMSGQQNSPWAP